MLNSDAWSNQPILKCLIKGHCQIISFKMLNSDPWSNQPILNCLIRGHGQIPSFHIRNDRVLRADDIGCVFRFASVGTRAFHRVAYVSQHQSHVAFRFLTTFLDTWLDSWNIKVGIRLRVSRLKAVC